MNKWDTWLVDDEVKRILSSAEKVELPKRRDDLFELATGGGKDTFVIEYEIAGKIVKEAEVVNCRNGLSVNYYDPGMRRRDPDCLIIGDELGTDKIKYKDIYGEEFTEMRKRTFEWLNGQQLIVVGINVGGPNTGLKGLVIAPRNAGFFVGGLADLQGMAEIDDEFKPVTVIYLAPVFRHTHFNGKQIVVHNRTKDVHEIFSYNLYPGPSAKKGIYGVLLQKGEDENWLTLHASTVQVVTPYENITNFLHEGASGSGKSEMLEYPHRQEDGGLLLGVNRITDKKFEIGLHHTCALHPVTDDMAMVNYDLSNAAKKLVVSDAEEAWFVRVNHITEYGTDPHLEKTCVHPGKPLIFLNIDAAPSSTALIWEHTMDGPGKRCPNPRVILPRRLMLDVINSEVEVDFRSFGIRTPLCSEKNPSYGIVGLFHILPPSLAWLWRLVSPRGHANPSIIENDTLLSEGVGSYWPFATGKYVNHANLLLEQILGTGKTRYLLLPNQHIGSWEVSFMPQWISREYFARRGEAKFKKEQLNESRCHLLGYTPVRVLVEGTQIPDYFFRVERQPEVGVPAYDKGAEMLFGFFRDNLKPFLKPELSKIGKEIITCCLDGGSADQYNSIIPMRL